MSKLALDKYKLLNYNRDKLVMESRKRMSEKAKQRFQKVTDEEKKNYKGNVKVK